MSLDQLILKGRSLRPTDAGEFLRQLARDERWPAVIKLIDEQRSEYVMEASKQSNATHPGVQAHAMGSVHALQVLLEVLSAAAEKPRKPRRQQPEQDVDS